MPFCGKRAVPCHCCSPSIQLWKTCVCQLRNHYRFALFSILPFSSFSAPLHFKYFSPSPLLIVRRATVPLLFQSDTFPSFVISDDKTVNLLLLPCLFRFFNAIVNSSSSLFLLYPDFFNCLEDSFEKKCTEIDR